MAHPYQVRTAQVADIPAIAELEQRLFTDPWSPLSFRALLGRWGLVAVVEREIVGYLFARRVLDEGEILNVAVCPERQRRGLGRALVEEAVARLGACGVDKIYLEVRASNVAAQGLYGRLGFAEVGRRRNYYRHPTEDAVLMALRP